MCNFIALLLVILLNLVSSVPYNEPCTFSFGTCKWSIGRRWHITTLDNGDNVLIADAENNEDKRIGFTDALMTSWLHSSSLCSHDIRLTFEYSIQNENDLIEIYLIERNRTRMTSIGQWSARMKNKILNEHREPIWHKGNVTFKAADEFRIDIEIRHLPDTNNSSLAWFAVDDLLIENCPIAIVTNTSTTIQSTEVLNITSTAWTTRLYTNNSNSTIFNMSMLGSNDFNDENSSTSTNQTLLNLILYLLCALIALTLLIILFAIIVFTYRKHCLSSSTATSKLDQRSRLGTNMLNNRIGIEVEHVDRNNQNDKTGDTNARQCFE